MAISKPRVAEQGSLRGKKITQYLDSAKYKYEIIEHKTTYTAWDTSQTEKIKPQEVVKALVMKVDSDYVMAMIPANRNLDKQKLLKVINAGRKKLKLKNLPPHQNSIKNTLGKTSTAKNKKSSFGVGVYKKIDFAKEVWMKKNLPGKVGAVPPFAKILGIQIYIDSLLTKNKKIYLGSGEYTSSIRVNLGQYLKTEGPVKGVFSKKK